MHDLSIVIPAKDEAEGLRALLPQIKALYPEAEVIVVNDGSRDDTAAVSGDAGARVLSNPYSMGNGAAIKRGARAAKGRILVFLDADGQHDASDIPRLLEKLGEGYDMVVGARSIRGQAGLHRAFANSIYNRMASMMTGFRIEDLTSGFRAVRANKFRRFLYLLPNGFSYPTTSTMAFFRSAYAVAYIPIAIRRRSSKSNIHLFRDGTRFFLIILRIGALFSPMRLFLPVSAALFVTGVGYYAYTFLTSHRFTNMSALLIIAATITFLIGIVSEQVSALHYRPSGDWQRDEAEEE
ncbi:MAG: glycosyltransferase family 2 protein [Acidiferrobacteraceae bacterium]|jgi:glycosyltransferase involved in cell wall biosynthesis